MSDMKLYTCHKQVKARPMTRGDYNDLRCWSIPADENPADEGYLVEYLDGGKPNVPGFAGYISWSPKDVFDKGYMPASTTFQERVIAEKADLDAKLERLVAFRPTDAFIKLDPEMQELLQAQIAAMTDYSNVLTERVAFFNKETKST